MTRGYLLRRHTDVLIFGIEMAVSYNSNRHHQIQGFHSSQALPEGRQSYHHFAVCNCGCPDEQLICQGALPVINVCYDREISYHIGGHLFVTKKKLSKRQSFLPDIIRSVSLCLQRTEQSLLG